MLDMLLMYHVVYAIVTVAIFAVFFGLFLVFCFKKKYRRGFFDGLLTLVNWLALLAVGAILGVALYAVFGLNSLNGNPDALLSVDLIAKTIFGYNGRGVTMPLGWLLAASGTWMGLAFVAADFGAILLCAILHAAKARPKQRKAASAQTDGDETAVLPAANDAEETENEPEEVIREADGADDEADPDEETGSELPEDDSDAIADDEEDSYAAVEPVPYEKEADDEEEADDEKEPEDDDDPFYSAAPVYEDEDEDEDEAYADDEEETFYSAAHLYDEETAAGADDGLTEDKDETLGRMYNDDESDAPEPVRYGASQEEEPMQYITAEEAMPESEDDAAVEEEEPAPPPVKKTPAKKPAAKKTPAKKPAAKKPATKKPAAKKPAAKKPAAKKTPAAKKSAEQKAPARKAPAKKPAAKKTPAKAPVKKTVAQKPVVRKTKAQKERALLEEALPILRKYVLLNRNNAAQLFAEYLAGKTDEEKKRLEDIINSVILASMEGE